MVRTLSPISRVANVGNSQLAFLKNCGKLEFAYLAVLNMILNDAFVAKSIMMPTNGEVTPSVSRATSI